MGKKTKSIGSQPVFRLPQDALSRVNLGQAFAEYDKVLQKPGVFVQTPALTAALDPERSKCFFVGRRGTGKTAITLFLGARQRNVITIHPQLFSTLAGILKDDQLRDVRGKPFHTLVACFKRAIVDEVVYGWVERNLTTWNKLPEKLRPERNYIESMTFDTRTLTFVEQCFDFLSKGDDRSWTKHIGRPKELISTSDSMRDGPAWDSLVLIDRIDDTWDGSDSAVVLLMALMHACLELASYSSTIQPLLFVRENLLQRVRQVDTEFTRLETAIVSLDWTKELLVEMIARRLHLINVNPKPPLTQTWDLFFDHVNGASSVDYVIDYCQQRPRDVLMYCTFAIEEAQSHKRQKVTADDLNTARMRFSQNRLKDVSDEYSENYPQLQLVLSRFFGLGQEFTVPAITAFIQKLLVDPEILKLCRWVNEHAAPNRFISLLYNIGFVGIRNRSGVVIYRGHGAKASDVPPIESQTQVVIHPCYSDALQLRSVTLTELDDIELRDEGILLDLPESFHNLPSYVDSLTALLQRLESIPHGRDGAEEYERVVGEVIRLCFFRVLNNVEAKSRDVSGTTVKDWVAANVAHTGFWEMLKSLYAANQIVWECKNYAKLHADDFHQAAYYMGSAIGNVCIMCFRGDYQEDHYYDHIKRIHDRQPRGVVLLLGDSDLKVFLRQAINGKVKDSHIHERYNYTVRLIS